MIVVHHLNNSRSQRILWLLEELGTPYEIRRYQRDAVTNLAPPELKAVHVLGKSPVITDGDATIIESGAITDYLIETYGGGRFAPAKAAADWWRYVQWLHFAEGSAMTPLLLGLYAGRLGEAAAPIMPRIVEQMTAHLDYLSRELGDRQFLVGNDLTGADTMNSFVLEASSARGPLGQFPNLVAYLERLQSRPAYRTALEKGGPYTIGR
jgi:glutathione S-transferase